MYKKISFDFDETLSLITVQFAARDLVWAGHDVHIVTSRMSNDRAGNPGWNDDIYIVANAVGIKDSNIHFCNLKPKHEFFAEHTDFIAHLDDDPDDINGINFHTDTEAILFVDSIDGACIGNFLAIINDEND